MFGHMLKESKADERLSIYELVSSTTADGRDFYAYIAIIPSKYEAYKIAAASGDSVKFTEYGDIVLTGWGKYPTKEIENQMEDLFHMNHNFESEIMEYTKNIQEKSVNISNQEAE